MWSVPSSHFYLFIYLSAILPGMWDLSSPTMDWIHAPWIGNAVLTLDHQVSQSALILQMRKLKFSQGLHQVLGFLRQLSSLPYLSPWCRAEVSKDCPGAPVKLRVLTLPQNLRHPSFCLSHSVIAVMTPHKLTSHGLVPESCWTWSDIWIQVNSALSDQCGTPWH